MGDLWERLKNLESKKVLTPKLINLLGGVFLCVGGVFLT